MKLGSWVISLVSVVLLAGCATTDKRFFEPGEPPRLRDGTIRMATQWVRGEEEYQDVRVIRARGGKVTCSFISKGRGHFVGEASTKEWVALWQELMASKPFTRDRLTVEPSYPKGGAYHMITLQLGDKVSTFSAQFMTTFMGTTSKDILRRVAHSNRIVNFVADHATRKLDEKEKQEAKKKAP